MQTAPAIAIPMRLSERGQMASATAVAAQTALIDNTAVKTRSGRPRTLRYRHPQRAAIPATARAELTARRTGVARTPSPAAARARVSVAARAGAVTRAKRASQRMWRKRENPEDQEQGELEPPQAAAGRRQGERGCPRGQEDEVQRRRQRLARGPRLEQRLPLADVLGHGVDPRRELEGEEVDVGPLRVQNHGSGHGRREREQAQGPVARRWVLGFEEGLHAIRSKEECHGGDSDGGGKREGRW